VSINDLSGNIENSVSVKIKEPDIFSVQVDESTDIGRKTNIPVFARFVEE
jgi:hypothetical protein